MIDLQGGGCRSHSLKWRSSHHDSLKAFNGYPAPPFQEKTYVVLFPNFTCGKSGFHNKSLRGSLEWIVYYYNADSCRLPSSGSMFASRKKPKEERDVVPPPVLLLLLLLVVVIAEDDEPEHASEPDDEVALVVVSSFRDDEKVKESTFVRSGVVEDLEEAGVLVLALDPAVVDVPGVVVIDEVEAAAGVQLGEEETLLLLPLEPLAFFE